MKIRVPQALLWVEIHLLLISLADKYYGKKMFLEMLS